VTGPQEPDGPRRSASAAPYSATQRQLAQYQATQRRRQEAADRLDKGHYQSLDWCLADQVRKERERARAQERREQEAIREKEILERRQRGLVGGLLLELPREAPTEPPQGRPGSAPPTLTEAERVEQAWRERAAARAKEEALKRRGNEGWGR
jgi:hypothetical protein